MPIQFSCPSCGRSYNVSDALAGKSAKCKACGGAMRVPAAGPDDGGMDHGGMDHGGMDHGGMDHGGMDNEPAQDAGLPDLAALAVPARPAAAGRSGPAARSAPPMLVPQMAPVSAPASTRANAGGTGRQPAGPRFAGAAKAVRANHDVGLDDLSPWLIIAFLTCMVLTVILLLFKSGEMASDKRIPAGAIWTFGIGYTLIFFAVTAPLTWLGIFIGSKIMAFQMPGGSYFRSAGIAAMPTIMIVAAILVANLTENVVVFIFLLLAGAPLAFYVLKNIFSLQWGESLVTYIFMGMLHGVGQVITFVLVGVVMIGNLYPTSSASGGLDDEDDTASYAAGTDSGFDYAIANRGRSPQIVDNTPRDPISDLLTQLNARDLTGLTREELAAQVAPARRWKDRLSASDQGMPDNAEKLRLLQQLDSKAAGLPSRNPSEYVFTAMKPGTKPTGIEQLGDEVSFNTYFFRPGPFVHDLATSESSINGLHFSRDQADVRVWYQRRTNEKQLQPWIITIAAQGDVARTQGLLTIDNLKKDGAPSRLSGDVLTFARFEQPLPSGGKQVDYITPADGNWLRVRYTQHSGDDQAGAVDQFVASIRPRKDTELPKSLLAPERLVERLTTDSTRAKQLLIAAGPSAEDAVIGALQKGVAVSTCLDILEKIASKRSVPALTELAQKNVPFDSDRARKLVKVFAGDDADTTGFALTDLKNGGPFKQKEALDALAAAKPGEVKGDRQKEVVAELQKLLDTPFVREAKSLGAALAVWAPKDAGISVLLNAALNDERSRPEKLQVAFTYYATLGDKAMVFPVLRWIVKQPKEVTAAMIAFGPVAEPEVLKLLRDKNPAARLAAAQILEQIGTVKSLTELRRASKDPRDKAAAAAAERALTAVQERRDQAKKPTE